MNARLRRMAYRAEQEAREADEGQGKDPQATSPDP
jgi:hypothetical protein